MPEARDSIGAWRSPVARMLWEHDVAGSNPAAPTSKIKGLRKVRNPNKKAEPIGPAFYIYLSCAIHFTFSTTGGIQRPSKTTPLGQQGPVVRYFAAGIVVGSPARGGAVTILVPMSFRSR
jgi:hypothetical protein